MSTPESEYAAAVWQWLRAETIFEPKAHTFDLDPSVAAAIRNQCEIEHRKSQ